MATSGTARTSRLIMAGGMDAYIYHEKQDSSLCGQHALNSLLQGPYFNPVDLAEIAAEFDAKEKELMLANGVDTEDAIKFLAEDSGNMNDSGFFSIEVLRTALERFAELRLISAESSEIDSGKDLDAEMAFICNRSEHWFTVRKIGGVFYNLNSLNDRPEVVSSFFLSAFLSQLRHDGYSVFVVKGKGLPEQGVPDVDHSGGTGRWYHASELGRSPGKAAREGKGEGDASKKARTEGGTEDYWAKLGSGNQVGGKSTGGGGQTLGGGQALGGGSGGGRRLGGVELAPPRPPPSTAAVSGAVEEDEDEQLARAIALSMAES